jgi:DNA-binding HxlR family transcriptional regulator
MRHMSENRSILVKAYEVAYALFRIASQIAEKDFSEQLRVSGTALLSATAGEDYAAASNSLQIMECLIKFAGDVNIIGTGNSDILLREVYALNAAINAAKKVAKGDRIDIAEIFSKPAEPEVVIKEEPAKPVYPVYENEEKFVDSVEPPIQNINTILKSAIRQTAILERIRQSGNCRLKDIQEILPGTSERTIRYDIQTLLEQDQIERVGIAGPSVYYRAKQAA